MKSIIKKHILDHTINEEELNELISKSDYNLNNIIANIHFYRDSIKKINVFDKEISNTKAIKDIFTKNNSINDIYRICSCDNIIIGLNIIENIQLLTNNMEIIDKIYYNNILGDSFNSNIYNNYNWGLIENIISFQTVVPFVLVKNIQKKKLNSIIYNKYISKIIIYKHNENLLVDKEYNYQLLFILYDLLKNNQPIQKIIDENKIPKKIFLKFIKYYEWLNNISLKKESKSLTFT